MNDTVQMLLWGGGLLLAVWIPTFGVTFLVMSSRKKKHASTPEEMATEVAASGAISLGVALLVSFGIVIVLGVCAIVAVVGFVALACSGH
jgi:hypothetical protein